MLSIILPVLNEGNQLQDYLEKLQDLRGPSCELIGVDGGSSDNSLTLLQRYCDQALSSEKGRTLQMNAGAAASKGEHLVFLHADTTPPSDMTALISKALNNADWGRFDAKLDANGLCFRIIEGGMNWRSRWSKVCTGDQALFFKRSFFFELGGYPEIPLMEDVALSKSARSKGKFAALENKVVTSARRWQQHGVIKTVLLMWELRLRYFLGQSPHYLFQRYYG